jgi:heme-degrading monooxygenase HmoA
MVLELAILTVRSEEQAKFEAAFTEARKIIASMAGFRSHQLQRCVETPGRYALLVQWDTIEHHMIGFRGSPKFQQWRALLGPYFAAPPEMEHYELISRDGP